MSQVTSVDRASAPPVARSDNSIESLDLTVFLELMLQELQNQDPLDPMDNGELLQQLNQIREISASDKLADTLDAVLVGQNVATATSLIGTEVEGLTDAGRRVLGQVRQVTVNDGAPTLEVAVETAAEAGDIDGSIPAGRYRYEVAWETDDGVFSVQVPVDTEAFGDEFVGSIRVENLPDTPGVLKRVYRSPEGVDDFRLVNTLVNATSFTDTLPPQQLGDERLTGQRSVLRYADAVEVKLQNISRVQTAR